VPPYCACGYTTPGAAELNPTGDYDGDAADAGQAAEEFLKEKERNEQRD
jgi:hypothetical protein